MTGRSGQTSMLDDNLSFDRLIQPVGADTFLEEFWQQKPLVIERGEPDFYSSIIPAADIEAVIGFRQLKHSQLKIAKVAQDGLSNKVFYVDGDSTSDVNRFFHSYGQGDTAVLNFSQCYWEPAARLCSVFERFFHFPAGANVYVTPRNAQGFPPHFDAHDVFVLQVEGSKIWRIQGSEQELSLRAGDLLYLPRGHVHEARTNEASSIHLSLSVRPYTWADLLAELVTSASEENVELQSALPAGFSGSRDAFRLIAERVPALISALADGSRIENGIGQLRERLIAKMQPLPDAHFRSLDRVDQIELDTLVAKRAGMMCHVCTKANAVEIAFPGNRMQGPAEVETAFRFIADANEAFPVRALPNTLSDKSKLVLARRSVREGLLTIAGPY